MGVSRIDKTTFKFRVLGSRDALTTSATEWLSDRVTQAISARGQANMALSGGSTPQPIYEALSQQVLLWESVSAVLVDERLGAPAEDSNSKMVKKLLVQNKASDINYAELTTDLPLSQFDISVLGMGADGHTASWFPGSPDLQRALDPNAEPAVLKINAQSSPGAGKYPDRITLNLPAIMNSRDILLLISGDEKRRVFENACDKSVYDAPVKALLAAGPRLTVMWAP